MKTFLLIAALLIPSLSFGATLTWTDNSNNEDGFRIERAPTSTGAFVQIGQVAGGIVTFTDAAGVAGNCYRVKAYNQWGESAFTNVACVGSPPAGPTGLTVGP